MSDRFICTAADPWTKEKAERSMHPSARCTDQRDGYPGGDIASYECPHCGLKFTAELAQ